MRLKNQILHKHLYRAENARPGLGGRSGQPRGPSKCYEFYWWRWWHCYHCCPSFHLLYIVLSTSNSLWIFSILFFMLAGVFGFWMWRLTLACGVLFQLSAVYSVIMCRAWPGTLVTWPWLCLSMIYFCALGLWSHTGITCQSCCFSDSVALSCCAWERCLGPEGWL